MTTFSRRGPACGALAASLAVFVLGCDDQEPAPSESAESPPQLTLQVTQVLASTFSKPTGVHRLANGDLVVPDEREEVIKVLNADGDSAWTFGREGQGPREYLRLDRVLPLRADSFAVFDSHMHSRKFLIFDNRLEFSRSESLRSGAPGNLIGGDTLGTGSWYFTVYGESTYIPASGSDTKRLDQLLVVRVDRVTAGSDTIGRPFSGSEVLDTWTNGVPSSTYLTPAGEALAFLDGWVAIVHQDPYRVDWITPAGDIVSGAPLPIDVRVVDDVDYYGIHPTRDLVCAPDGRLLVPRRPLDGDLSSSVRYDVISRSGQLDAYFSVGPNQEIIGCTEQQLFVAAEDEVGLIQLRVLEWPD